jgi:hypothetical protein
LKCWEDQNWWFLEKGKELPNISIYQSCTKEFAKVYHMAQKIKEKHTKVNWSMCEFWSTPKEVEYPNENKEFFMFIKNI